LKFALSTDKKPQGQAWTGHCAMAQAPPFDEHRRPLAPSKFFDNNGNNFSWPSSLSVII